MNVKVISRFTLFALLGGLVFFLRKKQSIKGKQDGPSILKKVDSSIMLNLKIKRQDQGLVFIEGGTFTKGQVQDDVMHDWNNSPSRQHVMSFYIDRKPK